MRQANWEEMFASRAEAAGFEAEVPQPPQGWRRLLWWEDLVTFVLLGVVFLAVIGDIDRANWVDDMPFLYPVAFLGLLMGAVLSRLRWPEGFIHLLALPVGAAAVLAEILTVVPGPTPWDRYDTLSARMGDWFNAAFTGGISNDSLPFIVLVVALSWLAAYMSSWAIFRWENAWLGLIPGGVALLSNISYLPGQFSFAFVIFLFGAALLVTRLHLSARATAWRRDGTPFPSFLSLSVLHASFWLALLLLSVAWLLPQANEAGPLEAAWRKATAPITERTQGFGRLFIGVNSRETLSVHSFDDTLPFLGDIELPETLVLDVSTEPLGQLGLLRAQSYDIYTPTGWQILTESKLFLNPDQITDVDSRVEQRGSITSEIIAKGETGETIFTVGQPRRLDQQGSQNIGASFADVLSLEAKDELDSGQTYQSVGSVSLAPEEALRAAGDDYPPWVEERYLQLPPDYSPRVRELAEDITRFQPTAYDQAQAIESYLRTIPYDLEVPDTPVGEDAVEYFLFEAGRGYFDYHASAMVVMLRTVGIPSRLAVGYVLQDRERTGTSDRFLVTEQSAFAWPEVYFPGLGWVEFNPTASFPPLRRPDTEAVAEVEAADPEEVPPIGLDLESLADENPDDADGSFDGLAGSSSNSNRWVLLGVFAGLASVAAVAGGGVRFAWMRGLGGLDTPAQVWGHTMRLASWARLPAESTQTPREYARGLRDEVRGADDVELLADAYVRHQFGRQQLGESERTRLEQAWRSVRTALLRRLFRLR